MSQVVPQREEGETRGSDNGRRPFWSFVAEAMEMMSDARFRQCLCRLIVSKPRDKRRDLWVVLPNLSKTFCMKRTLGRLF